MVRLSRSVTVSLWTSAALTVGAYACYWWVTWPSRTLRHFTELIGQGQFEEANRMLRPPTRWRLDEFDGRRELCLDGSVTNRPYRQPESIWQHWCARENLDIDARSIVDVVAGQQSFHFTREYTPLFFIGGTAERGWIRLRCEPWAVGI